jgi:hypothetical protein
MSISILSDPSYVIQVSPEIISRIVGTESPNNFQLQRRDFMIENGASEDNTHSSLSLSEAGIYSIGDSILVIDHLNNSYPGKITDIIGSPQESVIVDIPWSSFAATPSYFNDISLYDGWYFEGKLTINGVEQSLTIQAYPDSTGKSDLDVSGILQIATALTKVGDYASDIIPETTKSGSFTFAYRECYYGYEGTYVEEGHIWNYVEAVRSEEQGSNLYDYLYTAATDAPFFNQFEKPVLFAGLPFDISFFMPDVGSPSPILSVTIKRYDAANTLLGTTTKTVASDTLIGYLCSLNVSFSALEDTADHLIISIE